MTTESIPKKLIGVIIEVERGNSWWNSRRNFWIRALTISRKNLQKNPE